MTPAEVLAEAVEWRTDAEGVMHAGEYGAAYASVVRRGTDGPWVWWVCDARRRLHGDEPTRDEAVRVAGALLHALVLLAEVTS